MKQPIAIHISEPCHEDWDHMTPADKGRFCNACTKVVVDFTGMTNNEIIAYFNIGNSAGTCGRFYHYQLDRPLDKYEMQYPVKRKWYWFKKIAAMIITGCSLLLASCNRRSDVLGKVIGETTALDSQYAGRGKVKDTIPVKTIVPVLTKKQPKMGKTQIETRVLTGEVVAGVPDIIQGDTMPYYPEELPAETIDSLLKK